MARPPAAEALLNPELIVDTALRLIDADGLDALSMRKLAGELGVTPRSLYHYVPTKDALLRDTYIHVLNKLEIPPRGTEDWREALRGLARGFRALCHRHRSVMPYFLAGHEPAQRDTAILERVLELLLAAGLAPERVVAVSHALVAFLAGYILSELNGLFSECHHQARLAIAQSRPEAYARLLDLPDPSTSPEANFELALELMIAGIAGQRD